MECEPMNSIYIKKKKKKDIQANNLSKLTSNNTNGNTKELQKVIKT